MAAGFLTALANVPWGQVIEQAPKLVEQAQRLASNFRGRESTLVLPAQPDPVAELRREVSRLSEDGRELRRDLKQASELLSDLAGTNQLLIAKLTQWQRWFWALAAGTAVSVILAAAALAAAL